MQPTRMVLLCLGLCLCQEIKAHMETLSKPSIWAKPSPVVAPGTDVTLHCWMRQSSSEEMTITLLKSGTPVNKQQAEKKAQFPLPSVSVIDAGSYSCVYSDKMDPKKSANSDALDLVVTGSLPKPTFFAHPSPEVVLGGSVMLKCVLPPTSSSIESIMFILLKTENPEPVRLTKASRRWVEFHLKIPRVQDSGLYRCIYYEKTAQFRGSEPSESLNICLTDFLTKPSLIVQPSTNNSLGGNLTFYCQSPSCGTRFTLYKDGEEMPVGTVHSSQDKAEFLIHAVTKNHTGSYRCHHHTGGSSSIPSIYSDPLEVLVTGERDSSSLGTGTALNSGTILIITLCGVSILLFLVLLSYYIKRIFSAHGETPRSNPRCQHCPCSLNVIHSRTHQEVTYEEVSMMGRTKSVVEDPQKVIYTQPKICAPREKQRNNIKKVPETSLYVTIEKRLEGNMETSVSSKCQ